MPTGMTGSTPKKGGLSAPFADRELNGEVLLRELSALRDAQVRQRQLDDCALALRGLSGLKVSETIVKIRDLAGGRFDGNPALAALLVRWAAKLRTEEDIPVLVAHFVRLAVSAGLIAAIRRGAKRFPAKGSRD